LPELFVFLVVLFANVTSGSRSRSLYAIDRPSVVYRLSIVCLSVTLVHPILRQSKISAIFLRHLVHWSSV